MLNAETRFFATGRQGDPNATDCFPAILLDRTVEREIPYSLQDFVDYCVKRPGKVSQVPLSMERFFQKPTYQEMTASVRSLAAQTPEGVLYAVQRLMVDGVVDGRSRFEAMKLIFPNLKYPECPRPRVKTMLVLGMV